MEQQIAHMHEQLVGIAKKCSETSHARYTADDVRKLQNKLHNVDEKYQSTILQDKQMDPYEIPGEAQLSNELNVIHDAISTMLNNIE
ncbi:hypothetical protein DM01DRAFT_253053 [Hesseltinella vesiculosa]|uniref:Tubulin-specific chaperone A n=1 Tax=Hesseltinella vesiculosa TaxID=101127 RepID=A0A1X2GLV9_9FUNG|nr:hypothetical protein DM01DRAFT_253053 [Hesseltinella vesiculosa]